jgi:hypothetical protein
MFCGGLARSGFIARRRVLFGTGFVLLCFASAVSNAWDLRNAGKFPHAHAAARWLRQHTSPRAMIVGHVPHLEYVAGRETSAPPLPASEARNDPRVTWKRRLLTVGDWIDWSSRQDRPVYFLLGPAGPHPDLLPVVYTNPAVTILEGALNDDQ